MHWTVQYMVIDLSQFWDSMLCKHVLPVWFQSFNVVHDIVSGFTENCMIWKKWMYKMDILIVSLLLALLLLYFCVYMISHRHFLSIYDFT